MTITLCGSLQFIDSMLKMQKSLEESGHHILLPRSAETGWTKDRLAELKKKQPVEFLRLKSERMQEHFDKIKKSDAILVINEEKNSVPGYIGGNTLMEMAVAFYSQKKIFLLNPIPEMSYTEEIVGMQSVVLNGDLSRIN